MAVSATDSPATVIVTQDGAPGLPGDDGTDGAGFNNVRKALLDNPLSWIYTKNNPVKVLNQVLSVTRTSSGAYTDIYGQAQVAADDELREEVSGWLVNGNETHEINVLNNIPLIEGGLSVVLQVGSYSENSPSQNVFLIPGATGDLLKVGTDASGNWLATIRGSDNIEYEATTSVSATSTSRQAVVVTYESGTLNIYIDGVLSGTVTTATGLASSMDLEASLIVTGDYDLNMRGLRFYDLILNTNEIEYLD